MKIKMLIKLFKVFFSGLFVFFFLVLPASTNYKLKDYGFGSGGVANYSQGSNRTLTFFKSHSFAGCFFCFSMSS